MTQGVFTDLSGSTFSRWTVLALAGRTLRGEALWKCVCQCGTVRKVAHGSLQKGRSRSCGCFKQERATIHGQCKLGTTYTIWYNMIKRCTDVKNPRYKDYGGRGIRVCRRWLGPRGICNFVSDMGLRPAGLTLDRRNNDGPYSPSNCRWVSYSEQNLNRRNSTKGNAR